MKITVKTTQQKVFHVCISSTFPFLLFSSPSGRPRSLRDNRRPQRQNPGITGPSHCCSEDHLLWCASHPPYPQLSNTLVGKILTDDKTIESCGIKEKDFLVLMV